VRRRLRVGPSYDPAFHQTSSAYAVLGADILERAAAWSDWPDVSEYDAWAPAPDPGVKALVFRDVPRATVLARGGYDPFIRETGVIPTRSRSWHDFFNACIWGRFARAKRALHAAQLHECRTRPGPTRTRRQDGLTHLDECGVLIASDRPELLDRIARLAWHELFVERRAEFIRHVRVHCFGHAILEALRQPHVGLMSKALLWHDPLATRSGDSEPDDLARTDAWLARQLAEPALPRLHALPVLGLPGWHAANENAAFYACPAYFRVQPRAAGADDDDGGERSRGGDAAREVIAIQAPSPT
jgi:DUF3025 family protein